MSERITDRDGVGNVGRNDAGLFATPSRMLVKTVGEVELAEKSERLRGWVDPESSSTTHFAKRLFAES